MNVLQTDSISPSVTRRISPPETPFTTSLPITVSATRVRPEVCGFTSSQQETAAIVDWVRQRLDGDVSPGSICVVARTGAEVKTIEAAFAKAGVPSGEVTNNAEPGEFKVHCATMHRVKGLEYRMMVLANVSDGSVPPRFVEQLRQTEPADYERAVQQERSLLFVSVTRARDEALVTWRHKPSRLLPVEPLPWTPLRRR